MEVSTARRILEMKRIKWSGEDEAGASPEEELPFRVREEEISQKTSAGPNLLLVFPIFSW
jgi:hypothetical protein